MNTIPNEIINKLSGFQNQIWQTVSITMGEAAGTQVNFTDPLTLTTPTSDLYAEMTAPRLVIQFAFAGMPENSQVVLIPQETLAGIAELVREEAVESIDDNIIAEIRPVLESIVQGICLAVGNIQNEPIVATGLSVRYQVFAFPPNMQTLDALVRTNVAVSAEELNGSLMWLIDSETAHMILGVNVDDTAPHTQGHGAGQGDSSQHGDDASSGLELLLDIPLEISVELGRVRMQVKDVIELGSGSIVEINKAAGEPVDVMVNGRLVARGEVVVIEDNFGVRITEVVSPSERLLKLGEVA